MFCGVYNEHKVKDREEKAVVGSSERMSIFLIATVINSNIRLVMKIQIDACKLLDVKLT